MTVAAVPLNFTLLLVNPPEIKFVPVIVTDAPGSACAGAMVVIVGTGTVKSVVEETVVPLTVTVIFPVVAFVGTAVVRDVLVDAVTVDDTPLNLTTLSDGVVLNIEPLSVTVVPAMPDVGEKETRVNTEGRIVKSSVEVVVFPFTVSEIFPVVAPAGTDTTSVMAVAVDTVAGAPLKLT